MEAWRRQLHQNELIHYGVKRRSGRYPWGSGDRPYQRSRSLNKNPLAKNIRDKKPIVLSKEQAIFRSATSKSNFMNRDYTYVSVANELYDHISNTGEGFDGEHEVVFEMCPKRDLKIASFDDYFNAFTKTIVKDPSIKVASIDSKTVFKDAAIKLDDIPNKYKDGMFGTSPEFNAVIKELRRWGFDGTIDPVDGLIQYNEAYDVDSSNKVTAAVIFDPRKNLRIKSTYNLY